MQDLCKSFLCNLKKPLLVFFLFILISSVVLAKQYTQDYIDPITYSKGDLRWCLRYGVCTFDTLTVYNLSVIGEVFNVTMNLITWNITESFNVGGNLTADSIIADYFIGDGSLITGITASNVEDIWVNETLEIGNQTFQTSDEDVELRLLSDSNKHSFLYLMESGIFGFRLWYDGSGVNTFKFDAIDDSVIKPQMWFSRDTTEIDFFSNVDMNDNNISNLQCLELDNRQICSFDEINVSIEDINITEGTGEHWVNESGDTMSGDLMILYPYSLNGSWNGSVNYVPYTGADKNVDLGANNFTVDTNVLHVDKNSNSVGIGTEPSGAKLDVLTTGDIAIRGKAASGVGGSYGMLRFDTNIGSDDSGFKIGAVAGSGSAGYAWIQGVQTGISNDRNLVLQPMDGNVGIGVSTPATKLEVYDSVGNEYPQIKIYGADGGDYRLMIGRSEVDGRINFNWNDATDVAYFTSAVDGSYAPFYLRADPMHLNDNTAGDIDMVVGGGNVGIGTTTPSHKLEVAGSMNVSNLNVSNDFYADGNSYFGGGYGNTGVTIYDNGNISMDGDLDVGGNLTYKTIYAQLSDLQDQSFGATNTPQPINLTTTDEIYGLSVSICNITISKSGVYDIAAQPQVATGAGGAGKFHMWLEKHDTSQWVNVSNSNVELVLGNNEENVIPLLATLRLETNEKIRIMGSVSDTAIILDTQSPIGEPSIPSIIFRIFRLGE